MQPGTGRVDYGTLVNNPNQGTLTVTINRNQEIRFNAYNMRSRKLYPSPR